MPTPGPVLSPFVRGAVLLLLAVFLFDVMGAIIKHLGRTYPAPELSMFRNLFGLVPSLIVLFAAKDWHSAGRPVVIRQWKLGLLRGASIAFAQFCFYTALIHLEFATAATLGFTGPMFITAMSVPLLGTRVGFWRWLAVGVGFAGVVMIMRPGSDIFTYYALLPVCAAMGYAFASVTVRLMDDDVPSATINLYSTFGALLGSIALIVSTSGFVPIQSATDWLFVIGLGATGGVAVLLMVMAYRLTVPSNLAPFEYFGIPFSFAIGWYAFGEAPFGTLLPGALFIVAGGLLVIWRQRVRGDG